MNISEIITQLEGVRSNYATRNSEEVALSLKNMKKEALKTSNQEEAKYIWCLEQVLNVQDDYCYAFKQLKQGEYYEAWCEFEKTENGYYNLQKHLQHSGECFSLDMIIKHVEQFQSVYPYKVFSSPEYVKLEEKCSICGKIISLRNFCGHEAGEIYNGEMCYRIVTKADVISISLVPNPVQKYSVLFTEGGDQYDYSILRYLTECLQSPYHGWDMKWGKRRHPHKFYKSVTPDSPCPCESTITYKDCCLKEEGVLRPHCDIHFDVSPPNEKLGLRYYYNELEV